MFDLYFILGAAAAVIVISVFLWNVTKKPTKPEPDERILKRRARIRTIALLLVTVTILTTVEVATFSSTALVTIPDPPNQMTVKVIGRQFFWTFVYPNNVSTVGNLYVPVGMTIILNITSEDVFHSFAIQTLDVAKDAIPGHWNQLWFEVPTPANYTVACKELCGVGHFSMTGTLYAVNASIFNACYFQRNMTNTCIFPAAPVSNATSPATGNSSNPVTNSSSSISGTPANSTGS